jgi:hypothetical protein
MVPLGRSQRLAVVLGAIALSVVTICPPCRKRDVVLDPVSGRIEEISPWRGYVPMVELPRPGGTRGGSLYVAPELAALHYGVIISLTAMAVRSLGGARGRSVREPGSTTMISGGSGS